MSRSVIIPVLIPFVSAVLLALLNGFPRLERALNLASCAGQAVFAFWLLGAVDRGGIQVTVIGGWFAPWGIAFVIDRLAAIMLCLSTSVGALALAYACFNVEPRQAWVRKLLPPSARLHALHHLAPAVPYHDLDQAHRRLLARFPAGSTYRRASSPGYFAAIHQLFTHPLTNRFTHKELSR
jgi:hypothetical protein